MAVRRIKRVIQFSIVAVFLATVLLFLEWNGLSDTEKFNAKRRGKGGNFEGLIHASLSKVYSVVNNMFYMLISPVAS